MKISVSQGVSLVGIMALLHAMRQLLEQRELPEVIWFLLFGFACILGVQAYDWLKAKQVQDKVE